MDGSGYSGLTQFIPSAKANGFSCWNFIKGLYSFIDIMSEKIGGIYEILSIRKVLPDKFYYRISDGTECIYDEHWLEPVPNETIVIYRKGREVVAYDKVSKKKAIARCHPDDEFDFMMGAELAFERLKTIMNNEKSKEKLLNGKVVCIKSNVPYITEGKIYEFANGNSWDDNGCKLPTYETFDDFQGVLETRFGNFIKIVR